MTGAGVKIEGLNEVVKYFEGLEGRSENLAPAWDVIGMYGESSTIQRFLDQQAPDGNPWPPSLRALADGGATLIESGMLVKSITHNVLANGTEWGSNLVYAPVQQFGATIKAKTQKGLRFSYSPRGANRDSWATKQEVTIPPRPFLGINDEDEFMITMIMSNYLEQADAHG